ncbi:MAG TPA: hypothetical protein VIM71_15850 [Lacunisphaera sp.]
MDTRTAKPLNRLLLGVVVLLGSAATAAPPLLEQAAEKWMGERDNWAFTMQVREFDGGRLKEERLERYDPSKPGMARWKLLTVNGQPPTAERREEWQKRKTKKRPNPGKPLNQYLDFAQGTVVKEDARTACYNLPLRSNNSWLFPLDKVVLRVTVNKATLAIEVVQAEIEEPFKVALGFARVMDLNFDVQMNPSEQASDKNDPAAARPDGTARAVVTKLGDRIEYVWSDFQRVTPHPDNVILDKKGS